LRIDVVMLGIDRKTGRAEEWLPAVLLDKQLYLFDTELGLPIPGPGGRGIATLAQAIADPQLLESLDIGDKYRYRVRPADLDKVVVLLDASAEYLAQRMRLVEQNLSAADQLVLSVSTSDLKQELEGCQGVTDVRLWAVPLEADMYQRARMMMMAANREMQWQEFLDHGVFQELSTVARGRRQHLLGNFEKQGDNLGATSYYLAARMSDAQIAEMETNRGLQKALGLEKTLGMPEREWQQRLQQLRRLQVESKAHASYWLGLTHLENKDYEVAANWFKVRTLDNDPEGQWTAGARYNLARCYEALGRTEEARQLYLIDESPQRHGCLLRARQLEAQSASHE
jgi:tetratricopeptide (TPR) repeat protein